MTNEQCHRHNRARPARVVLWLVLSTFGLMWPAAGVSASGTHLIASHQVQAPTGATWLCQTYAWACAGSGYASSTPRDEMKLVKRVNNHVNGSVREISDREQFGREEHWTLPSARGGDCEDFALMKKWHLMRAGVDPQRLLIATVFDRRRGSHAVLIYRSRQGDLVLDNLTNRIVPWTATRYVFLRMQDPQNPSRWVGGFSQG